MAGSEGKKRTFSQLVDPEGGAGYTLVVPKVQRDFALGRSGEEPRQKRTRLLEDLFNALLEDEPLDLNFVYGSVEGNRRLILLDGQQRLTTLFLLHWYLAMIEHRINDFRKLLERPPRSCRFTYETRTSSREFCNNLVRKGLENIHFEHLVRGNGEEEEVQTGQPPVRTAIRETRWFYLSRERDPTVDAMIRMLDAIHRTFQSVENGFPPDENVLFDRMTRNENPLLYFWFLELEEFGLSEDLYIKLNARGRPLTTFENFKATFEQLLDERLDDAPFDVHAPFSDPVDNRWTDLFWAYRDEDNRFDDRFMNFLRAILTNHYALQWEPDDQTFSDVLEQNNQISGPPSFREHLQALYDNNRSFSVHQYEDAGCFDFDDRSVVQ